MILEHRRALGLLDCRQLDVVLFLGSLNAALDVANRVEYSFTFVDPAIQIFLEAGLPVTSRGCSCAAEASFRATGPCCRCRRTAARTPRADSLHRQRLRRAAQSVCV